MTLLSPMSMVSISNSPNDGIAGTLEITVETVLAGWLVVVVVVKVIVYTSVVGDGGKCCGSSLRLKCSSDSQ